MSDMDCADWYAIAVRSGREFEAVEELSGVCREVRCPTRQVVKRAPDRSRFKVDAPVWDGYAFACVPDSAWDAVHDMKAVYGPVCVGLDPLAIRGGALKALMRLFQAAENGEFDEAGADERIAVGDMLRVIFGSWHGHEVRVISRYPSGQKLVCEANFELMGKKPLMVLNYDEVQPFKDEPNGQKSRIA